MILSQKISASVLAGLFLVPSFAFASPADEEGQELFRPVLTQEQVAAMKARVQAENARAAAGTAFEWYLDEEYAAGLVPEDISERVIAPDDGFSSSGE